MMDRASSKLGASSREEASSQSPWVIAGLSLPLLLASLSTSITNSGLPVIASALEVPFRHAQWIVLAYLLSVTTLIVTAGYLGDLIGKRKLLLVGIQLFTAGSLASGTAPNLGVLIVARALQGIGAAMMMSLTLAMMTALVPKEKTGRAMGLLGTISAAGTAAGPTLGGILIGSFGWRSIFILTVPLGIFAFFLASKVLPSDSQTQSSKGDSFDWIGTLLLGSALAAFALAMTTGRGTIGQINTVLLSAALAGLGLFIEIEKRAKNPLIQLQIFQNRKLNVGLISSVVVSTVMMATLIVGPFYLSRGLGLGEIQVGLLLSVGPVVVAISGVWAGRLADKMGASTMSIVGLVVLFAGTVLLTISSLSTGIVGYAGPIVVLTVGYALFQTANTTAIMTSVLAEQRGSISGLLSLSRNLGLIMGASAMGAAYAFASGVQGEVTSIPASAETGMKFTFAIAAGLVASTLVLALASEKSKRSAKQASCSACNSH